jgi:hypothetical protein
VLEDDGHVVERQSAERREPTELGERLHRRCELGRLDVVGEEAVERRLVDLEDLRVGHRADRGAPRSGGQERELAEALSRLERSQDAGVTGLGVLVLDGESALAEDEERVGSIALTEHRVLRWQGSEPYPTCEIRQHVFGKVLERGEPVDHLCGLDAPRPLASEAHPLLEGSHALRERPDEGDHAADRRSGEEQREDGEQETRAEPPVPELAHDPAEDVLPEEERRVEREDREDEPHGSIQEQSDLLCAEPFADPELVPHVALHEGERARPQVSHLDQVGEDPVSVQLEERDEVQQDHVVVQDREAVQEGGDAGLREEEHDERGDPREGQLGERPGERLHHPLPPVEHQPVG